MYWAHKNILACQHMHLYTPLVQEVEQKRFWTPRPANSSGFENGRDRTTPSPFSASRGQILLLDSDSDSDECWFKKGFATLEPKFGHKVVRLTSD